MLLLLLLVVVGGGGLDGALLIDNMMVCHTI